MLIFFYCRHDDDSIIQDDTEDYIAILGADGSMQFDNIIIEDLDFDETNYDVVAAHKPNSDLPVLSILSKESTDSSSKQPECSQIAKPGNSSTSTCNTAVSDEKIESVAGPSGWSKYTPSMLRNKKNELLKTPKELKKPSNLIGLKEKILQQQLDHARIEHEQRIKCFQLEHEKRMEIMAAEHELKVKMLQTEPKSKE